MNLLFVDDDVLVLEDLKKKLDWDHFGFDRVYTAENIQDAMQIVEQLPIHTIICDIEMPLGSGLEFLVQLRTLHINIPCILLTSYARFEYAREAVSLHIIDYLLKPVTPQALGNAVRKALDSIDQACRLTDARKYSEYWLDEQRNIAEFFWLRAARSGTADLEPLAEKLGYGSGALFAPALLECIPNETGRRWDAPMLEYAVKNIGYELLCTAPLTAECVVQLAPDRWLAIVSSDVCPLNDSVLLDERFSALKDAVQNALPVQVCASISYPVCYGEMRDAVHALVRLLDETIDRRGRLLHISDTRPYGTVFSSQEINLWETLLRTGDGEALIRSLQNALEQRAALLTLENMQELRQDIAQLVYSFLKQHEVQAHRLFSDTESDQLYRSAHSSIVDMIRYCRHLVDKALGCLHFSEDSTSVVETVKAYLDKHYAEDIQRADLSAIGYISPDYLSRLFKKETGQSLVQYITEKRIGAACDLLRESRLPINAIALQVGFSNFAYFSKVFREATGLTPMNYRKQFKK